MPDEKQITIDCLCEKRLLPEEGTAGSFRIHCVDCGLMTGWHTKVGTAANIWLEFCNKAGKKIRMLEAPEQEKDG